MIEVSVTEIALFGWAMVATLYAFRFRGEREIQRMMMRKLIEDEGTRNEVLKQYQEWKSTREA